MNKKLWLIPTAFIVTPLGAAEGLVIEMHHIDRDGVGAAIGTVTATEGPSGSLELRPALSDLPPGAHGFHVHENPSCGPGEKDGVSQAASRPDTITTPRVLGATRDRMAPDIWAICRSCRSGRTARPRARSWRLGSSLRLLRVARS
jgi:Copper/zinc superoxide dismutase (SODC)